MRIIPGIPDLTINTLFCIGRNYERHAEELGNSVPDQPIVFLKPNSSIIGDGESIQLPPQSKNVHHEVELVIAIGKEGKNISVSDAQKHIAGYAIGIDVTARDIQQQAKDKSYPWSVAKGFDSFAPVSDFLPLTDSTDFSNMKIQLSVDQKIRQDGNTRHMIFPVEELIAYLSAIFTLQPGDLVFTGTPEGVSPLRPGDAIHASLNNDELTLDVSARD